MRTSGLSVNPIARTSSRLYRFSSPSIYGRGTPFRFYTRGKRNGVQCTRVRRAFARASRPAYARDFYSIAAGPRIYFFFIGIQCAVCGNHRPRRVSPHITVRGKKKKKYRLFVRLFRDGRRSDFKSDEHRNKKRKHFLRKSLLVSAIICFILLNIKKSYVLHTHIHTTILVIL